MANMFADMARKAVSNSRVREGRTVIQTTELVRNYPEGITIVDFDILNAYDSRTKQMQSFPTVAFAEDTTRYWNGGSAMMNIASEWLKHFEGDIESCVAALKASGGVKIKVLPAVKTGSGNSYTPIEVIG